MVNAKIDNFHGGAYPGTCVGHMIPYVLPAGPADAFARLRVTKEHRGQRREGRGRIACNRLTTVRPCTGATLSPTARIDSRGKCRDLGSKHLDELAALPEHT